MMIENNLEDSVIIKKIETILNSLLVPYGLKDSQMVRYKAIEIYQEIVKPAAKEEWERAVMLFYPSEQGPS